jgi:hypothetical protein
MADIFKIKHLFELMPSVDFEDEFVISQEVVSLGFEYETQATGRNYALTYDNYLSKRHIQTLRKEKYSVKFLLSRNIDITRAQVGYTTCTTTLGDTFAIRDVSITYEKIPETRNYVYTIQFYKYSDEIINHLSSDNALAFHSGVANVNVINYTVDNPSLVFNNVTTYPGLAPMLNKVLFKLPIDAITTQIEIADRFYLHTDNTTFNIALDTSGEYLSYAHCWAKDSDYVYFYCNYHQKSGDFVYVINTLVLDFEPDYRPLPTGITITGQTFTFNIYTFINPIYSNPITVEGELTPQKGVVESDQVTSLYKAELKVFLKDSEMYLAEFLNYATFNDITLTLSSGTILRPSQTKGLIKEVERDNLIGLHEYDINLVYNPKNVNLNR